MSGLMRLAMRWAVIFITGAFAAYSDFAGAAEPAATGSSAAEEDLFAPLKVRPISILIDRPEQLRRKPRDDVDATVIENNHQWAARVHLKGSLGSFRPIDGKPGLTIGFDEGRASFHGVRKIHLNNSVEDGSFLNELLGSELFRKAGVPAPRTTYAMVILNGRRLGMYVLKEGFTEEFLAAAFGSANGRLYEPGEGHDIGEGLDLKIPHGESSSNALPALANAIQEPNLETRWTRLQQVLDINEFISFAAMEMVIAHRDGYCLARNNFRVFERAGGRVEFLPHGMDQLFGSAPKNPYPRMSGNAARAVMETRQGGAAYWARLGVLASNVFDVTALNQRIDEVSPMLRGALSSNEREKFDAEVTELRNRIAARRATVLAWFSSPEPLLKFQDTVASLTGWEAADVLRADKVDRTQSDGKRSLHVAAAEGSAASWRTRVRLPAGSYRFEGRVRTKGLKENTFGRRQGAALCAATARSDSLLGSHDWSTLAVTFAVTNEDEVSLICEVRASQGEAWFAEDSLKLRHLTTGPP